MTRIRAEMARKSGARLHGIIKTDETYIAGVFCVSESKLLLPLESENESKTEHLVRKHFKKYHFEIKIAEGMSDTSRIEKLLKTASKNGIGKETRFKC